ncbi:MAG: GntR family transcriptional regulator [Solobacterium sp.]|nr:GntR family transcriptional regulator [Solobacterium sp.]MBQ6591693.1 GntR family transcriptional regulator [Solobacterium sp.]MBR0477959.1 GntR family transcriptional regulator [Solobacterium sp.]
MRIIINNNSMIPIYEQIVSCIKDEILTGTLSAGEGLPSVRGMAADLKISSLTVKKAYDLLEEEGLVTTVHGKGTFVNETDHQLALEARKRAVEDEFEAVLDKARHAGLSEEEIRGIIEILLEE